MEKLRILMSGQTNLQSYADAVTALGVDAKVEYLPEIDTSYDALVLCGGTDIDPKYYGQEIDGSVNINNERDALEFKLLKAYIDAGKPVMGICRGHQLINVFFGGSLYQDIADAQLHTNRTDHYITHDITVADGCYLEKLYGKTFPINSAHHQAVLRLGEGLRPIAFWNDLVEAYEHTSLPIIGVQWHPEKMCFGYKREDTVDGSKIFTYFFEMCRQHKECN